MTGKRKVAGSISQLYVHNSDASAEPQKRRSARPLARHPFLRQNQFHTVDDTSSPKLGVQQETYTTATMGLSSLNPFGSSTSTRTSPKPSADGAFIAPDRTSRAKCYEARDAFFQCLDKNGILDAIKDEEKARIECGNVEKAFGRDCAGSWVGFPSFFF